MRTRGRVGETNFFICCKTCFHASTKFQIVKLTRNHKNEVTWLCFACLQHLFVFTPWSEIRSQRKEFNSHNPNPNLEMIYFQYQATILMYFSLYVAVWIYMHSTYIFFFIFFFGGSYIWEDDLFSSNIFFPCWANT